MDDISLWSAMPCSVVYVCLVYIITMCSEHAILLFHAGHEHILNMNTIAFRLEKVIPLTIYIYYSYSYRLLMYYDFLNENFLLQNSKRPHSANIHNNNIFIFYCICSVFSLYTLTLFDDFYFVHPFIYFSISISTYMICE